jgi:cobalt-zinc-cadmium efflux system membrane fusion protein
MNIYSIFLASLLLGLAACSSSPKEENQPSTPTESKSTELSLNQAQIKKIGLTWGESQSKELSTAVFVNGKVDVPPQNQATVHARQEGFVQSIKVLPGDFVKRGQILAVLENRDYLRLQEMYLTAKSELNYLQKELKRQQELRAEDINAEKTLQQVERDLQIKQAQEASLRQQLALLGLNTQNLQAQNLQAYFSLVSPIMGYVETVDLSMGEFVSMNKPLIKIKGTEHKHLELMVFEKEATMINKGQKITFQVPSLGQERYGAEVFLVGQSFDAKAKTINVHAHILDAKMEEKLVPGMFVNANILLPAQSHATLPEEAIIQEGKNYFVFLKGKEQGGKVFFDKIAVKVFNTQDGYTAFAPEKAIPQKAQFVQKGAYYLQAQLMNAGEE